MALTVSDEVMYRMQKVASESMRKEAFIGASVKGIGGLAFMAGAKGMAFSAKKAAPNAGKVSKAFRNAVGKGSTKLVNGGASMMGAGAKNGGKWDKMYDLADTASEAL